MVGLKIVISMVFVANCVHGLTLKEQEEIVSNHNNYRANVNPPAADMQEMSWYDPAGKTSQYWASQCVRGHDKSASRKDAKLGSCGQNIYTKAVLSSWTAAVKAWHSEVAKFTYNAMTNQLKDVGHYTQVVWAETHKVGCGYAQCKDAKGTFHNYVCNYCPAGNYNLKTPYKKGAKCSACLKTSTCLPNKFCSAPK